MNGYYSSKKPKASQNVQQTAAVILAAGTSSRMGAEKNKLLLPLSKRPVLAHVIQAVIGSQARPIVLVLGHEAQEVRAQIQPYLGENQLTIIENPDYRQGMSSSMQAGLRVLSGIGRGEQGKSEEGEQEKSEEGEQEKSEEGEHRPGKLACYTLGTSEASSLCSAGGSELWAEPGYKSGLTGVVFVLGDQPMITATIIDRLIVRREQTGKRIVLPLYQSQRGNPVVFSLELADELMQVRGDEGGRSLLKRYPDQIATLEMGELAANVDVDTWEAYLQVRDLWEDRMLG